MIIWIFLVLILFLIIYKLFFTKPKPLYHKNIRKEEIIRFLKGLEVGADGTILIIEHQGSDKFIQFVKHIVNDKKRTFSFGFPDALWAREYFEPMKKAFDAAGIKYTIVPTGDKSEWAVHKFLDIYDIGDITVAEKIAFIALNVMGIKEDDSFIVHYEGYVSHEESKRYIMEQRKPQRP